MIYIYITPTCQSCRKTIKWFDEEKIEYKSINILKESLTKEDIFRMLKNSYNGFDDIISKNSKPYLENNLDIDNMKTSELINFIISNPTVLKRPIIVAPEFIEVGYNKDDIRAFIPKERRIFNKTLCDDCDDEKNKTCDHINESLLLIDEMRKAVRESK